MGKVSLVSWQRKAQDSIEDAVSFDRPQLSWLCLLSVL